LGRTGAVCGRTGGCSGGCQRGLRAQGRLGGRRLGGRLGGRTGRVGVACRASGTTRGRRRGPWPADTVFNGGRWHGDDSGCTLAGVLTTTLCSTLACSQAEDADQLDQALGLGVQAVGCRRRLFDQRRVLLSDVAELQYGIVHWGDAGSLFGRGGTDLADQVGELIHLCDDAIYG